MCFFDEAPSHSYRSSRYKPKRNYTEETYVAPRPVRYAPPPYRSSSSSHRQHTIASGHRLSYGSSHPARESYNYMTVARPVRTTVNPSKPSSKTVRYAAEPSPRRSVNTYRSSDATLAPVVVQQQRRSAQYIK